MSPMKRLAVLLLPLFAGLLGGCNWIAFPLYVLSPGETPLKVQAEYAGLKGQTVAVLVYAGVETLYEYRYNDVRLELGEAVGEQLRNSIKGCRTVEPVRVTRYQDANLHWDSMPIPEIGRALKADYVLYISLEEFATREPGSTNLARGRITARCTVWDTHPAQPNLACVWQKDRVAVIHPKDQPLQLAAGNQTLLRLQTEQLFAEKLVKAFYDHKEAPSAEE